MKMKFDLALFQKLNDEFKSKPLVKRPPTYDSTSLADRGGKRAKNTVEKFGFSGSGLEIGCGRGEVCRAMVDYHNCTMVGVDVVKYPEWDENASNPSLNVADLSAGDLPDIGPFDFAYSNAVFEHIVHPHAMLKRVFDMLKPGGKFYLSANLYRGPKASHRYREVYFPWPHLLFSDDVFEEFYVALRGKPARAAWVNQLSIADYYNYFRLIGYEVENVSFSKTPINEEFYKRFNDKLSRIPRFDLERDFIFVLLRKPS